MKKDDEVLADGPVSEYSVHIIKMSDGSIQTPTTGNPSLADVDELITRAYRSFGISLLSKSLEPMFEKLVEATTPRIERP